MKRTILALFLAAGVAATLHGDTDAEWLISLQNQINALGNLTSVIQQSFESAYNENAKTHANFTSLITANQAAIQLQNQTIQNTFNEVKNDMASMDADIQSLQQTQTDYNSFKQSAITTSNLKSNLGNALSDFVKKSDLNSKLNEYAKTSEVNSKLSEYLKSSEADGKIEQKVNSSIQESQNALKSEMQEALAQKADKSVTDEYGSKIGALEQKMAAREQKDGEQDTAIQTAQTTATTAQTTAETAQTAADAAQTTADEAFDSAITAQETAETASDDAIAAQETANEAQETATAAQETAEQAEEDIAELSEKPFVLNPNGTEATLDELVDGESIFFSGGVLTALSVDNETTKVTGDHKISVKTDNKTIKQNVDDGMSVNVDNKTIKQNTDGSLHVNVDNTTIKQDTVNGTLSINIDGVTVRKHANNGNKLMASIDDMIDGTTLTTRPVTVGGAPYNKAYVNLAQICDQSTIGINANSKLYVKSFAQAWVYNSTGRCFDNASVILGSRQVTPSNNSSIGNGNWYLKCDLANKSCTLTTSSGSNNDTTVYIHVGNISNGSQTWGIYSCPCVACYE